MTLSWGEVMENNRYQLTYIISIKNKKSLNALIFRFFMDICYRTLAEISSEEIYLAISKFSVDPIEVLPATTIFPSCCTAIA